MLDGRGMHMKAVKDENRRRIIEWLSKYEGKKTKKECCEELGITYFTLRRHLREIKK